MISTRTIGNSERERGVWVIGALAALGVGAFAAMGSAVWVATAGILALLALIALTLPLRGVALLIAALIPFQIYFFAGESSFTLRAALVLTFSAALRVIPIANYKLLFRAWLAPAFAFLAAALIAALGADSRYLALRGIYDFAALFATAFLFSALLIPSAEWLRRLLNVLIGAGTVQSGIGIVQQIAGAERVLAALQNPLAPFFYQPNLLIEKLSDLSFNWLTFER
ncbi:MAG: hypothetical protein HY327_07825, partial [Chloroflexi bacterium]|nr:hypothetical protein [Chloroflexota bacterium]